MNLHARQPKRAPNAERDSERKTKEHQVRSLSSDQQELIQASRATPHQQYNISKKGLPTVMVIFENQADIFRLRNFLQPEIHGEYQADFQKSPLP
jgi:hypothetical protein